MFTRPPPELAAKKNSKPTTIKSVKQVKKKVSKTRKGTRKGGSSYDYWCNEEVLL
jgi:hypothetical protein